MSVETNDELAPVTFGAIMTAAALSVLAVGLALGIAVALALLTQGPAAPSTSAAYHLNQGDHDG